MKIVNGILIMSDLSCIIYLDENNPKDINTIIGCVIYIKKINGRFNQESESGL